jgi:Arc/MetJ family transcription regulator
LVQAYRWLNVILRLNGQIDLKAAATTLRARVATKLSTEQITVGEALSKQVSVR